MRSCIKVSGRITRVTFVGAFGLRTGCVPAFASRTLRGVHYGESIGTRDNSSGVAFVSVADNKEGALEPDPAISLALQCHLCVAVMTPALAKHGHNVRLRTEQRHGNLLVGLPSRVPRPDVWCLRFVQLHSLQPLH
jgi:hypothetical protein